MGKEEVVRQVWDKATWKIFVVSKVFCFLTLSMSTFWLYYCTLVFQDVSYQYEKLGCLYYFVSLSMNLLSAKMAVQWLGLSAFTTEGLGSIPGQRNKIPQTRAAQARKKKTELLKCISSLGIRRGRKDADITKRACMLCCVWLCDPWTVARQAPLSMEILQARLLEWVAITSSRGSFWPRDQTFITCVSCIDTTWKAYIQICICKYIYIFIYIYAHTYIYIVCVYLLLNHVGLHFFHK